MSSLSPYASVFIYHPPSTASKESEPEKKSVPAPQPVICKKCGKPVVKKEPIGPLYGDQTSTFLPNDETGFGVNRIPAWTVPPIQDEDLDYSIEAVHGMRLRCLNNYFNFPLEQLEPFMRGTSLFNLGPGYFLPSIVDPYYYYVPWAGGACPENDVPLLKNLMIGPVLKQVHYIGDNFKTRNPKTLRAVYRNPIGFDDDDPLVFYRFYYFCCPCLCKTWISPLVQAKYGCTCRDCGNHLMPCGHIDSITPYKGHESCYAKYECPECGRSWSSKYSLSNSWEKCFSCKVSVYPYYQVGHSALRTKVRRAKLSWKANGGVLDETNRPTTRFTQDGTQKGRGKPQTRVNGTDGRANVFPNGIDRIFPVNKSGSDHSNTGTRGPEIKPSNSHNKAMYSAHRSTQDHTADAFKIKGKGKRNSFK